MIKKKALYIYSFYSNGDTLDYDWFVGEDFEKYDEQEMEVANYMVENGYGENYDEALEMLESVYKQVTAVLLKDLQDETTN